MEKLRIVICDENKQDAEHYEKICRELCEDSDVPAEFKLYSKTSDFLFDMKEETFAALMSILIVEPDGNFAAIPATARKQGYDGIILYLSHSDAKGHMIQAFDSRAYNYLFKGDDDKTLGRFIKIFCESLKLARTLERQYTVLYCAGEYKQLDVKGIGYFESISNHIISVVYNGGVFQFVSTLKALEERLLDRGFIRVHRSFLIAVDAVHSLNGSVVMMNNGHTITVSRNLDALKEEMEKRKLLAGEPQ
jgi:DNA-binding LytR/AlgR family response regulator